MGYLTNLVDYENIILQNKLFLISFNKANNKQNHQSEILLAVLNVLILE